MDLPDKKLLKNTLNSYINHSWPPSIEDRCFQIHLTIMIFLRQQGAKKNKFVLTVSARKKLSMWSSCLWNSTSDIWQYPQGHRAPYCKLATMSLPTSRYLQRKTLNMVSVAKKGSAYMYSKPIKEKNVHQQEWSC